MRPLARSLLLVLSVCLAAGHFAHAELGDVVFKRKSRGSDDVPVAVFPHYLHRMQFKCYACHDEPFQMKTGAADMTMDAIEAGEFCGACHDGKAAFQSTFESCPRCHRP